MEATHRAGVGHTPGPWKVTGPFAQDHRCDLLHIKCSRGEDDVAIVGYDRTDPDNKAQGEADARLVAASPATDLVLRMLVAGVARIDGFELCFDGLRYSHGLDWSRTLDVIGWAKARAALTAAGL